MKNITSMIFIAAFNIIIMISGCHSFAQIVATDFIEINELKNGGAENGKQNWQANNPLVLTYTVENHTAESKKYGKKFFRLNFTDEGSEEAIFSQNINLPAIAHNKTCVLSLEASGSSFDNFILMEVLDAANIQLTRRVIRATAGWAEQSISFFCGTSSQLKVRIIGNFPSPGLTVDIDNIALRVMNTTEPKFYWSGYIRAAVPGGPNIVDFDNISNFAPVYQAQYSMVNSTRKTGLNPTNYEVARIACVSGTPATGSTCPTNERSGFEINLPRAGTYEVCANFSYRTDNVADAAQLMIDWTSPTDNTAQSNETILNIVNVKATSATSGYTPIHICQAFNFTEVNSFPMPIGFTLFGKRNGASSGQTVGLYLEEGGVTSRLNFTVREI